MAKARMGFEGRLYTGNAGSEGSTFVQNKDIAYEYDYDAGDTTERDETGNPPIETKSVTVRKFNITWNMLNREGNAVLATLLAAAYDGQPVAIRTKDYAAGKGYDGDCILKVKHGKPLNGEQTYDFTAEPNGDLRTPQPYV